MKHNHRISSIILLCQLAFFPGLWATNPSIVSDNNSWNIIPVPASITPGDGIFLLESEADIYINPGSEELKGIGNYLAGKLNPATGFDISVLPIENAPANGNICLALVTDPSLGAEGYRLSVTPGLVTLEANQPAGLFRGIQTIRQVLPPGIDSPKMISASWEIAAVTILDTPRYEYRSFMLDVARHFQSVENVKRVIDQIAYYKLNYFHLHLANDQGWRIEINGWPNLTAFGGQTQVGGNCEDCFYTQGQYEELVDYAAARYITLVPEIDMPGHTNAALSSYPGLNCNGKSPSRRTDIEVGYSSLCTTQPLSTAVVGFVTDVITQLSTITPGPYFHIGGDESLATSQEEYSAFISYAQSVVHANGKAMLGWEEVAQIPDLAPTSIVQFWNSATYAQSAMEHGSKIVMSPCAKTYLDIKYDPGTRLGLDWCGYNSLQDTYSWNPGTYLAGVTDANILGIEGLLWGETILTMDDIEYMLWPRLAGLAEIGWSPVENRSWSDFIYRLGSHGPRWQLLGIDFFPSGNVPWEILENLVTQESITPTGLATPFPTGTIPGEGQVSSSERETTEMITLQDFVLVIRSHPVEISITLLGFLLLFLAGFWTSNAGRPVNGLRMNIHKFIALGLAAYLIVILVRIQKGNGWDTHEAIAVSISGILAFAAILTGGLSSLKGQVPLASLIHKITPYLVLLSTFVTLWFILT